MQSIWRRLEWFRFLAVAGTLTTVGCEYVIGKVYLDRTRAQIYLTENEQDVKDCDFLKQISSTTRWGGFLLQNEAQERTISNLTHEASQTGANVLLIREKSKSMMGSKAFGEAYRCKEINFVSTRPDLTSSTGGEKLPISPEANALSTSQQPTAPEDVVEKLKQLKELRDTGILTEEEYRKKREVLVDKL